MLLNSYIADMTKYANQSDTVRIFEAYDSLPAQLAKDAKKFQYKLIKSGARASQYGDAIDWLIRAGIVNKCMKCSQGFYPVVAYQDVSAFKLYYSDMGIMSARLGMTLEFGLLVPDGYAGFVFPKSGLSAQGIVCELPPICHWNLRKIQLCKIAFSIPNSI